MQWRVSLKPGNKYEYFDERKLKGRCVMTGGYLLAFLTRCQFAIEGKELNI